MQIEIRSYRGIDRADLFLNNKVTLLVGENATGKSSTIEAVQAVLTANPNIYSVTKADADGYVNDGAKEGSVTVKDHNGIRKITYPDLQVHTMQGAVGVHRLMPLGLMKLADLAPADRAVALESYAGQKVDRERLQLELEEAEVTKLDQEKILDTVFGNGKVPGMGWDAGEKWASKECTARKALFQSVAGCKWGANQGITFLPEGFTYDMVDAKLEDLEKVVVTAREVHEQIIRANAFSEAEIDRLQQEASRVEFFTGAVHQASLSYAQASQAAKDAASALAKAKAKQDLVKCSQCGIKGVVKDGELIAKPDVFCEDSTKMAELEQAAKETESARSTAQAACIEFQTSLKKAEDAVKKLKELETAEKPEAPAVSIDDAKKAIAEAELRVRAFKAKKQGTAYHKQIVALSKAADAMKSTGLRMKILVQNLKPFNDKLAETCRAAGWGTVFIDANLNLKYEGRHWKFLSASQQFRVEATIQMTVAKIEDAPLVVIDEADILDRTGRNQLFNALKALSLRAVVGMTVSSDKEGNIDAPNLANAKPPRGETYWVSESTIVPLETKLRGKLPAAV